ncbi:MAG: hypothetical protein Q8P57_04455 [Candidatus Pacearchaeota archaeon]|nr:hypothetical protein [Candidatus Pacearchaeota archaeon]
MVSILYGGRRVYGESLRDLSTIITPQALSYGLSPQELRISPWRIEYTEYTFGPEGSNPLDFGADSPLLTLGISGIDEPVSGCVRIRGIPDIPSFLREMTGNFDGPREALKDHRVTVFCRGMILGCAAPI